MNPSKMRYRQSDPIRGLMIALALVAPFWIGVMLLFAATR